jgi:hypothetical protein|tara:strand:- start:2446 stop:2625 length:180 start_codon:yes stop_codon:yes gene_type:complete
MKKLIALLFIFSLVIPIESCGNKHACGTKQQKRSRHKRIKKNTNFMSGFYEIKSFKPNE